MALPPTPESLKVRDDVLEGLKDGPLTPAQLYRKMFGKEADRSDKADLAMTGRIQYWLGKLAENGILAQSGHARASTYRIRKQGEKLKPKVSDLPRNERVPRKPRNVPPEAASAVALNGNGNGAIQSPEVVRYIVKEMRAKFTELEELLH